MLVVIAGGTEVAALGRVIGRAAAATVPSSVGGPGDTGRRSTAYSDFHRHALAVLAWTESTIAIQQSVSAPWRAAFAAVGATVPATTADPASQFGRIALAARQPALILLAGQVGEHLDYQHAIRREVTVVRDHSTNLLAAYADVQLLGGAGPIVAADRVVTLIGELLTVLPVAAQGFFRRPITPSQRYVDVQAAIGHYLRAFNSEARTDLARWPWRRHLRNNWWQIHRPKRQEATVIEEVDTLISATRPATAP